MKERRNKKENVEKQRSEETRVRQEHAPIGYSLLSLSITYSLVRLKGFDDKPFRHIILKWLISMAGFPYKIAHSEEWFSSWT